jgi:hypothetical protein
MLFATLAHADTLHIGCTGGTTCVGVGGSQGTGTNPPTFNVTIMGNTGLTGTTGELWLAILEPGTQPTIPNFTVNTVTPDNGVAFGGAGNTLVWSVLGETGGTMQDHKLSSQTSLCQAASTPSPSGCGSFTVYDVLLNSTFGANQSQGVSFTGTFPIGSIFVAFLEDTGTGGSGGVVNANPNSEDLVITGSNPVLTPEPVSMLLFGTGLVALGARLRRRKSGNLVAA